MTSPPSGKPVVRPADWKQEGRSVRSFSTYPEGSAPPPQRPIWYRFRTAITAVLVANAIVIGYALFRTKSTPEIARNVQQPVEVPVTDGGEEKTKSDSKKVSKNIKPESEKESHDTILAVNEAPAKPLASSQSKSLSGEEQDDLYKWMLAEKRKVKPSNAAEKAKLDEEKALLKQYIRGKKVLSG